MSTVAAEHDEFVVAAQALIEQDKPASAVCLEPLGNSLVTEFQQAELDRRETEKRWLDDLRQYKGKYDPDTLARIGKNRSKAFVRKTRVKVKTVDSRVADLLFPAGSDKNWDIAPTPKPSLSGDQLQEIRAGLSAAAQQQPAQPGQPAPKISRAQFDKAVLDWAKERCKKMSLVIDDQLADTRFKEVSRKAIHSGNLYGTGIIKGPLVERKIRTRFVNQGGKWLPQSETYIAPFVDFVPLWRFFPDGGSTELLHCRFVWERHLMTPSEMAELAARKTFASAKIKAHMLANPKGLVQSRYFDTELRQIGERTAGEGELAGRYEVLERWGYLTGQQLRDAQVEVSQDRLHESFFSNVWMLPNGEIIKAVLQPINGVTWPYHIYYFDKDETSFFGEGLATIMRDDQSMVNAGTRLMIDNAAITSGPQLEVTPSLLSKLDGVDEFNPWKVWLRNTEAPGQPAVRAISLESRMGDLSNMINMFENNSDEVTAIPRYMSGENATNGAAGTSSGLSMLMGNVNIVIKDLIGNWDQGVTVSFIRGLYFWNMQFHPDDKIKGDYDVAPRGTASLVAKEVRSAALDRFAQLTNNPLDAPFIKRDVLNRQRAEVNELIDVVKTEEEVAAEQGSELAKKTADLQMKMQELQVQDAQAKVAKLLADAEVAKTKTQEMMANIDVLIAKAVQTRVEAAYAALQAGGTATTSPFIAPAGDEILRSSGWIDKTPTPTIAQLDTTPVQTTAGQMTKLNKGQTFAVEPRGDAAAGTQDTGDGTQVNEPNPAQGAAEPVTGAPPAQTGMVGREQGIETPRIEA